MWTQINNGERLQNKILSFQVVRQLLPSPGEIKRKHLSWGNPTVAREGSKRKEKKNPLI